MEKWRDHELEATRTPVGVIRPDAERLTVSRIPPP
jgi:hypothetical protein